MVPSAWRRSKRKTITCGGAASNLESQDGGVDIVERAVDERGLDTEHGKAGHHTGREHGLNSLLHTGYVLLRDGATLNL